MNKINNVITTESVGDKIYGIIKKRIINGTLLPEERLRETNLSIELNVSRTPLREALQRLEIEGWVFRHSRGILRVSNMTLKEAKELYSIREVLEGLLVKEATKIITIQELDVLKDIIEKMKSAARINDSNFVIEYGKEFHNLIYQVSQNKKCLDILSDINDHLERYRYIGVDSTPKRGMQAVEEHQLILDAIIKRDSELAESKTREHIRRGNIAVIEALAKLIETKSVNEYN